MKKRNTLMQFTALIVGIFFLGGCLNGTTNQPPSQVQFGLQVDSLGTIQSATNGDKLMVTQFRFVYGDGAIIFSDSTLALAAAEATFTQFNVPNNSGQNPILITRGPVSGSPTYQAFVLSLRRAPANNSNISADFISGTKRFSLIIDGSYNGSNFSFKSSRQFKDTLAFRPVKVQEQNQSYSFLINSNINRWFSNNTGGFLDPTKEENRSTINDQIEQSFSINATSSVGQ